MQYRAGLPRTQGEICQNVRHSGPLLAAAEQPWNSLSPVFLCLPFCGLHPSAYICFCTRSFQGYSSFYVASYLPHLEKPYSSTSAFLGVGLSIYYGNSYYPGMSLPDLTECKECTISPCTLITFPRSSSEKQTCVKWLQVGSNRK